MISRTLAHRRGRLRTCTVTLAIGVTAGTTVHAEPDEAGPFEVEQDVYDEGDLAFVPSNFPAPVEFRAVVHSPVEKDAGPFPLVLMLHGRHATCYDPDAPAGVPGDGSFFGAFAVWPCPSGMEAIPSYEGYDYAARSLASHGYIVVSISANGVAAHDNNVDDGGARARADLLVRHLNSWPKWNATEEPPFAGKFIGAVDLERVGVAGHSRGGEGAAGLVALDQELGSPFGIDAVFLIAPTDFGRPVLSDVALGVLLPYCDGDVFDLQGAHYFDDARYAQPGDLAPKYTFLMHGSNHNFYNTLWSPSTFVAGAVDDFEVLSSELEESDSACGPGAPSRLSELEQQATLVAYMNGFFRAHLGGESEFEPLLHGDVVAASAAVARVQATPLGPDDPDMRLDVNRLAVPLALESNEFDQAVVAEALDPYALCGLLPEATDELEHCVEDPGSFQGQLFEGREPHTPGLGQLRIAFAEGSRWTNALPPGTDVSIFTHFQFRAGVDFEGAGASARDDLDFTVVLTDGAGQSAGTTVSAWSWALAPPPGNLYPILPKKILNAVRIPLHAFEGVDLTDLVGVAFVFDQDAGALLLSDVAFTDVVPEEPGGTGTDTGSSGGDDANDDSTDTGDTGGAGSNGTDGTGSMTSSSEGTGGSAADADDTAGCGCRSTPRGPLGLLPMLFGLLASLAWGRSARPGVTRRRHRTAAAGRF